MISKIQWTLLCIGLFSNAAVCQNLNCDSLPPSDSSNYSLDKARCGTEKNKRDLAEIKDSTKSLIQFMLKLANYNDHLAVQLRRSDSIWIRSYKEDCRLRAAASYSTAPEGIRPLDEQEKVYASTQCEGSFLTARKEFLARLSFTLHDYPPELIMAKEHPKKSRRKKK